MLNGIILVKCGEIILKMKLLAYYSVIVVFAPLSWGDGVGVISHLIQKRWSKRLMLVNKKLKLKRPGMKL
ncbi:MAG: hypothetical protein B6I19_07455 [Bacteroidetes bacterium 4572_114]|nr:MAG: hypothetical protein B6I19_07455 [Bacteroidetes bacterium 4572_114]